MSTTYMTTQNGQPPKAGETITIHTPTTVLQTTYQGPGVPVVVPGKGTWTLPSN